MAVLFLGLAWFCIEKSCSFVSAGMSTEALALLKASPLGQPPGANKRRLSNIE
jgi:hypothetical protein